MSIRSELADDLPSVVADPIQLQQVILNLFMNAAEAMTSISDRERLICVRSEKHNGDGVRIAVEDSGPGVEAEDAKRIFRTHSLRRSQKGWGWAFQSAGRSWKHMAAA